MYCVKCGVKLADSEKICPLCGTKPYHPDIPREEGESLYPADRYPEPQFSRESALGTVTMFFLMAALITMQCDLQISGRITWSGYVLGALALGYEVLVLPGWFDSPNPVVFVPCGFGAAALYLLYINHATAGNWFFSFALPVVVFMALLFTGVTALLHYIRGRRLYVFGGAFAALGLYMPVMEALIVYTFRLSRMVGWSIYPLIALVILGGFLIFLALCRPARESMERKFFL